eukprot:1311639-Amphidinium_carterae.1
MAYFSRPSHPTCSRKRVSSWGAESAAVAVAGSVPPAVVERSRWTDFASGFRAAPLWLRRV